VEIIPVNKNYKKYQKNKKCTKKKFNDSSLNLNCVGDVLNNWSTCPVMMEDTSDVTHVCRCGAQEQKPVIVVTMETYDVIRCYYSWCKIIQNMAKSFIFLCFICCLINKLLKYIFTNYVYIA